MTVKIITDTSADLNLPGDVALYEDYDIATVPMHILFGNNDYEENINLTPSKFYKLIQTSDVHPRTSQPTQFDILRAYEKYGKECDEIVSFHISSKLSGSYKNALFAKRMYEKATPNPAKVYIVDCYVTSICQGLMVIKAAQLAKEGWNAEEIIKEVTRWRDEDMAIYFTVEDLRWLFEGGRLSRAKYYIAKFMSLKPILTFIDGGLGVVKRVSNMNAIFNAMARMALEKFENEDESTLMINLGEAMYREQAEHVMNNFLEEHPDVQRGKIFVLGGTIAAHTGPGTLVFVITRNFNY